MNKTFFLLGLIFFLGAATAHAQEKTLNLAATDHEIYPCLLSDSKKINDGLPGTYVEFIGLLEKSLGIKIILTRLSYDKLMEMEKKHDTKGFDGVIAYNYTRDADKIWAYPEKNGMPDYSKSLDINRYYFYKNKQSPVTWNGVYLANISRPIGADADKAVFGMLDIDGYKYQEMQYPQICRMISEGKLELGLCNENFADYYLKNNPKIAANIVKLKPQFTAVPYFIILSDDFVRKDPKFAKKFWFTVGLLRGEYEKIEARYLQKIK
jgi:hypothetical protein